MTHREWQIESFKKLDRCNISNKQEVIPINACVGSGKTNVASYSLGSFIKNNQDKKTIQAFITPRIKLCAQQAKEIEEFILKNTSIFPVVHPLARSSYRAFEAYKKVAN